MEHRTSIQLQKNFPDSDSTIYQFWLKVNLMCVGLFFFFFFLVGHHFVDKLLALGHKDWYLVIAFINSV